MILILVPILVTESRKAAPESDRRARNLMRQLSGAIRLGTAAGREPAPEIRFSFSPRRSLPGKMLRTEQREGDSVSTAARSHSTAGARTGCSFALGSRSTATHQSSQAGAVHRYPGLCTCTCLIPSRTATVLKKARKPRQGQEVPASHQARHKRWHRNDFVHDPRIGSYNQAESEQEHAVVFPGPRSTFLQVVSDGQATSHRTGKELNEW